MATREHRSGLKLTPVSYIPPYNTLPPPAGDGTENDNRTIA